MEHSNRRAFAKNAKLFAKYKDPEEIDDYLESPRDTGSPQPQPSSSNSVIENLNEINELVGSVEICEPQDQRLDICKKVLDVIKEKEQLRCELEDAMKIIKR